jgi:hypothetical protein
VFEGTRFDCDDGLRGLTGSACGFADRASPVPTEWDADMGEPSPYEKRP